MTPHIAGPLAIAALEDEAHEEACAALMAGSDPWRTLGQDYAALLRLVRLPGRERHVALVDGRVAGFVLLQLQGTFAGYIQTIGMAPAFRGQGLGSALIDFAEQRILREHQNVFLCVSSFNHAAQRFYRGRGYQQVGELPDFVVRGHSELLLRKTIGPLSERRR